MGDVRGEAGTLSSELRDCPRTPRAPTPMLQPSARRVVTSLRVAGALALGLAASPSAVAAQTPDHDAAYQVVTALFDGMRARDTSAMRAAFVPNATMQSISATGVKFDGIEGWLRSVGSAPAGTVIDERLANPVVHVDGNLASIWVDYWLFVGERLSHCGVDAILLAKHEGAWRIFSVVDTRRREGCSPAPSR